MQKQIPNIEGGTNLNKTAYIDIKGHIGKLFPTIWFKEEGLLNISTMSSGMWYHALLETNVTHLQTNSGNQLHPCRIDLKYPEIDWKRSWSLAATPGLSSKHLTFLWRMAHDLLPTQARLFRLRMPNANSEIWNLLFCNWFKQRLFLFKKEKQAGLSRATPEISFSLGFVFRRW